MLSLIANFTFARGRINGQEKTLIESMEITPLFQLECMEGSMPCLCIEKLSDFAGKDLGDPELEAHVSQIARYARLVRGKEMI